MLAGAGWGQTEARSPRNDPPKRVVHGPNYRPPYAAIVVDDKSGFVLHGNSESDETRAQSQSDHQCRGRDKGACHQIRERCRGSRR